MTTQNTTQAKKQVIFMIGAGGSGKSYSLAQSEFSGLQVVNSDSFIEASLEWVGNGGTKEAHELHEWASELIEAQWDEMLTGDTNFVLDGTGKTRANVEKRMAEARANGFEVVVFWVYAELETCLARNEMRPRKVPATVIQDAWVKVKANFPHYRRQADKVKISINY